MTKSKNKVGRPTKYLDTLPNDLIDYFDQPLERQVYDEVVTNRGDVVAVGKTKGNYLPTVEGYCAKLRISKRTFHDWVAKYPEFSHALEICKPMQINHLLSNSLVNNYSAAIGKLLIINLTDYEDKKTVENSGEIKVELPSGKLINV